MTIPPWNFTEYSYLTELPVMEMGCLETGDDLSIHQVSKASFRKWNLFALYFSREEKDGQYSYLEVFTSEHEFVGGQVIQVAYLPT